MNRTIGNEHLTVTIAEHGAELQSIRGADGTEYLWQGDPAYWTSHAPNIFPYVARLTEGKYTLRGKEYGFGNHGLVRYEDLAVTECTDTAVSFTLEDDEKSFEKYPFRFRYTIRYEVKDTSLLIRITVENRGKDRMYYAVGGHPGFNVPLEEGLAFTDYYLEFDRAAHPYRVFLADSGAVTPRQEVYQMEEDRRIRLAHDLFDHDAVVLHHAAKTVTIRSEQGKHSVTACYPDFRYIGFWHKPCTEAPYVCIEPWTSLPSREGIVEDLALQADLLYLDGGESRDTSWQLTFA